MTPWLARLARGFGVPTPFRAAVVLLVLWAAALALAALRLQGWQTELTRTLLQLNADAEFRRRFVTRPEAVDPEWYRRKAVALLTASERLQQDAAWTVFLPGSWHRFDNLEERVADRLAREFDEIVVETLRRELLRRGAALTRGKDGEACALPAASSPARRLSGAPEDLPEYVAMREYVAQVEALDRAVRALDALQRPGPPQPDELRVLVRYALAAELPGTLARSAAMFQREDGTLQATLLRNALQWSTRCSLYRGMSALYARLLDANDLFALEGSLREHGTGLFDAGARPLPFDRAVERLRTVASLLGDQDALLAQGRNAWMGQATLRLGPGYDALLQRVGGTMLLGPEAVSQLTTVSGTAFAQFRRQFEALFGDPVQPGIVWLEGPGRFGLSPQRQALREGLAALLAEPFMADDAAPTVAVQRVASEPVGVADAQAWVDAREHFKAGTLPKFPAHAQPAMSRLVDARIADLIYQQAFRSLGTLPPEDSTQPFDAASYRARGERVQRVEAMLRGLGAATLGARLHAAHASELQQRLARHADAAARLVLDPARLAGFGAWQGEGAPLWQAVGVNDALGVQRLLAEQALRLESITREVMALVEAAGPEEAAATAPWRRLAAEFDRWRARRPDSSLLALERYFMNVGPDLRRDNCAQRLAAQQLPGNDDAIAQRLRAVHEALSARCQQLRGESPVAPAGYLPAG